MTQPSFLYWSGELIRRRMSPSDEMYLYPLRRLADAGVELAGSSDAPVVEPEVIAGIRATVQRRTAAGTALAPHQALNAREALSMYTAGAARALGLEHERGRIAPGLKADFVVLNQNPLDTDVGWDDLRVEMTIVGGEVVYRRD